VAVAVSPQVVSFPAPLRENQYQRNLYEALAQHGYELTEGEFKAGWLWRHRGKVKVLHFHWPQDHWRHPPRPKGPVSWVKMALFALRLATARLLGYTIAWTIHEVYPLKTASRRLDEIGSRLLVRAAQVLVTNDRETAEQARRELRAPEGRVQVIPHASYSGDYAPGRPREEVRAELGIDPAATVFILFGHVSVYKRVEWFVDAFRAADIDGAVLLVAGLEMDEGAGAHVRRAAAEDPRVVEKLEFIPDEAVAELYGASDVALCPRQDGGTSAVLILALSMGVPAIAARRPTYEDLTGGERAGWLFEPDDRDSLIATLRRAAGDPDEIRRRAAASHDQVADLSWEGMGARLAELLRAA
jgi:glycosyltransferase involved in cell wall biosynthesis